MSLRSRVARGYKKAQNRLAGRRGVDAANRSTERECERAVKGCSAEVYLARSAVKAASGVAMAQCQQADFCAETADAMCSAAAVDGKAAAAVTASVEMGLRSFHAAAAAYNVVYACTACALNALLAATVLFTPSLHSPPNAFLVSLCANNVLLALSASFPIASAFGASALTPFSLRLLDFLQVTVIYACNANYWLTFAAVGRYRFTQARGADPAAAAALTAASRWRAVRLSVGLVWALSAGASIVYAVALVVDGCLEAEARSDGAVTFYLRGGVAAAEAAAATTRSRAVVMYAVVVLLSTGLIGACLLVVLRLRLCTRRPGACFGQAAAAH